MALRLAITDQQVASLPLRSRRSWWQRLTDLAILAAPSDRSNAGNGFQNAVLSACWVDSTMEHELMVIRAETLAIQAVLTNVLFELKLLDPTLADAIAQGFDNAANQIEDRAIQAGRAVSSETLLKSLSIIEDLRTASIGRHDRPRHIV